MVQNLKYLLLIRLFAIGGQVVALLFMQYFFSITLPVFPISIIIIALGLFTVASWWHTRNMATVSQKTFLVQLLVDLVTLSLLIYFTGGSINPFISLFIIPIIFAAASLKTAYTWVIALIALASYTTLMFYHIPLIDRSLHAEHMRLHIWGMWYGFILSAVLVAYFVSRIAKTIRDQDRLLAAVREEQLHAEQILALGTLAAGTAHELGTPLSTMAVLSRELEHGHTGDPELAKGFRVMREQIDRCKSILARMAADAGQLQANSGHRATLDKYLLAIIDDWRQTRSDVDINLNLQSVPPGAAIIADQTLSHAIINVLNNAADASSSTVGIDIAWNHENLNIKIHNDGHGIEQEMLNHIGEIIISSKSPADGMGLGLFLARTTFNRYGGNLQLINRESGGVTAEIMLPLSSITTN